MSHNYMELIRTLLESHGKPFVMTVFGPTLMGLGAVNMMGKWEDIFRIGSAFFGFLTAIGGFVIMILSVVWWFRRVVKQKSKPEDNE